MFNNNIILRGHTGCEVIDNQLSTCTMHLSGHNRFNVVKYNLT